MAAVASLRSNQDMIEFYAKLNLNGKPPKVALVAVMWKLVILENTLISQQRKRQQVHP
jgi:transposase